MSIFLHLFFLYLWRKEWIKHVKSTCSECRPQKNPMVPFFFFILQDYFHSILENSFEAFQFSLKTTTTTKLKCLPNWILLYSRCLSFVFVTNRIQRSRFSRKLEMRLFFLSDFNHSLSYFGKFSKSCSVQSWDKTRKQGRITMMKRHLFQKAWIQIWTGRKSSVFFSAWTWQQRKLNCHFDDDLSVFYWKNFWSFMKIFSKSNASVRPRQNQCFSTSNSQKNDSSSSWFSVNFTRLNLPLFVDEKVSGFEVEKNPRFVLCTQENTKRNTKRRKYQISPKEEKLPELFKLWTQTTENHPNWLLFWWASFKFQPIRWNIEETNLFNNVDQSFSIYRFVYRFAVFFNNFSVEFSKSYPRERGNIESFSFDRVSNGNGF